MVRVPFLVIRYSSTATSLPLSFPEPLSLMPPKGASAHELFPVFYFASVSVSLQRMTLGQTVVAALVVKSGEAAG